MVKFSIKWILKNHQQEKTTENARLLILNILKNKDLFKKYRYLLCRLAVFFLENKKFTKVHFESLVRIQNG